MAKELAKLIGGLLTTLLFGAAVLAGFVYEHSIIAIKQGFHLKTAIADDENSSGSDVVAASINAAIANRLCEICDAENTFKDILDEIIELAAELY